ncbi:hypothetical protein METP3_02737 [Methanosarcinales archaeon]|nr:hypothetical protein METP3_02737 [Methanosarcinales archaeon]
MKNKIRIGLLMLIMLALVGAPGALALSSIKSSFNTQYGTAGTSLDTCNTCHSPSLFDIGGSNPVNYYGRDLFNSGNNFVGIQETDSDGDGYTNLAEINARTFPGDPASHPAPTPVLTTISVSPATVSLSIGGTQTFIAAPKDQFGNPIAASIVWSSSNTSVGTVSASGVLTAVSAGTTTVTATSGSVKGTAAVTVTAPSTGKATVKFVVTDSKTRRTIHEAKVSFGGKTKETDDHGMVEFTDVVLGTYKYKVSKERYQTITNSINVTGDTITVYVKMLKTRSRDSQSHD